MTGTKVLNYKLETVTCLACEQVLAYLVTGSKWHSLSVHRMNERVTLFCVWVFAGKIVVDSTRERAWCPTGGTWKPVVGGERGRRREISPWCVGLWEEKLLRVSLDIFAGTTRCSLLSLKFSRTWVICCYLSLGLLVLDMFHLILTVPIIKQESKSQIVFGPHEDTGSRGTQGQKAWPGSRVRSCSTFCPSPVGTSVPLLYVLPWSCAH